MAVLTNKEVSERFGLSDDQIKDLEAQADEFDAGEWPRGKITRIGRPKSTEEPTKPLTFRIRSSKVEEIDAKASALGMSRGDALRAAVDEWLMQA